MMTMQSLNASVTREPRMDMKYGEAKSGMQSLFKSYDAILKRNGLSWIIPNDLKLAVSHICSAIRPLSLQNRLVRDLEFSNHHHCSHFKDFLAHTSYLSDAFHWSDPAVTIDFTSGCQPKKTPKTGSAFGHPSKGELNRESDKKMKDKHLPLRFT